MQATRKAAVRFRERSELLDFLLEVTAATAQTLDLDQLLANVAEIIKKVIDCELFPSCCTAKSATTCGSAMPTDIAKSWCATCPSRSARASRAVRRPGASLSWWRM